MLLRRKDVDKTANASQKFLERGGVEVLLSLMNEINNGELDTEQLVTLQNIWRILRIIIRFMNKSNMVDIDKILPIIDCSISSMGSLNNIDTYDATAALDVKEKIFSVLGLFMKYNAEMIEVDDFQEKNVFHEFVQSLKNPVDNSLRYDEGVWGSATLFFSECCKQNRKLLSRKADFEIIIQFMIHFIKVNPNHTHNKYVFDVLYKATVTIGKKKIMKSKNLLTVLGTVADEGNEDVGNDVQSRAITFMTYLFEKS